MEVHGKGCTIGCATGPQSRSSWQSERRGLQSDRLLGLGGLSGHRSSLGSLATPVGGGDLGSAPPIVCTR